MDLFLGIFIALGVLLLSILARSITTFFHELGHAIPSLLFTDGEVIMIVGSYGDVDNSIFLNLGRLKMYLKIDMLTWYSGVCMHSQAKNYWHSIFIILGGPIASLMIAIGLSWMVVNGGFSPGWISLICIYIISAFWDFCVNMYPSNKAINMDDGTRIYCDGYRFLQFVRSKIDIEEHQRAMALVRGDKMTEAIQLLERSLEKNPSRYLAEELINLQLLNDKPDQALKIFENHIKYEKRKDRDYLLLARLYHAKRDNHEALRCINKYLYTGFQDPYGLNVRGEINVDLSNYEDARLDFRNALEKGSSDPMVQNNLGFMLTKEKYFEPAGKLINSTIEFLKENARAQFQAGMYYRAVRENEKALACLSKAKALGFQHHGLEHYLLDVE